MTRVLITGARAPVALHLSRLFRAAGHQVVLADSHHWPLAKATRPKSAYIRLPAPRGNVAAYASAVADAVDAHGCDLVIPTCEEVFFLAAARDLYGRAIRLFAPPLSVLADAHHKGVFAQRAAGFAAGPPPTDIVASKAALSSLGNAGHRVLKPAWSRFGSRVLIRPSAAKLETIVPTAEDPFVVQDYLPGEEICAYGIAVNGVLCAFAAYRPTYRAGRGAGIAFEPVTDQAARDFAAAYAGMTGWTGQLSFDFRRDAAGGLHAIECNPRATSGLHFFAPGNGLAEAILAGAQAIPTDLRPMTLPLAMLCYGLPSAIRSRTLPRWWQDFCTFSNILAFPGDTSLLGAQFLALAEIAGIALRAGKTLQQAATDDIEWNGEWLG